MVSTDMSRSPTLPTLVVKDDEWIPGRSRGSQGLADPRKFVVDSFNRLQSGGKVQEEWPDKDLWLVLQAVLEARPPAFLMVSWMPAHLDASYRKEK